MEVFGKWSNSKESTKLSWHEQLLLNFIQEYFYTKFVYKNFTRGRIYFENFWPRRSKYLDSRKSCYSYLSRLICQILSMRKIHQAKLEPSRIDHAFLLSYKTDGNEDHGVEM